LFTQCVHKSAMMDLCCYAVLSSTVGVTAGMSARP
jgi:hypothetical protein